MDIIGFYWIGHNGQAHGKKSAQSGISAGGIIHYYDDQAGVKVRKE